MRTDEDLTGEMADFELDCFLKHLRVLRAEAKESGDFELSGWFRDLIWDIRNLEKE